MSDGEGVATAATRVGGDSSRLAGCRRRAPLLPPVMGRPSRMPKPRRRRPCNDTPRRGPCWPPVLHRRQIRGPRAAQSRRGASPWAATRRVSVSPLCIDLILMRIHWNFLIYRFSVHDDSATWTGTKLTRHDMLICRVWIKTIRNVWKLVNYLS